MYDGSDDILVNPILIVEVSSASTLDYDRGVKFERYKEIPSLRYYLVIRLDSICVEHYAWRPDGSWSLREHRGEASRIQLLSIGCELHLGSVYEGVMDEAG